MSNLCIYFYPLNSAKVKANNLALQQINNSDKDASNGTSNNGFIIADDESIDLNELPVGNTIILKANDELMYTTRF